MTDEFLTSLKNDWREQDSEFESVRQRLARARWASRAYFMLEAARTAFVLVVGIWFAFAAWEKKDLLLALSAATVFIVAPIFGYVRLTARRDMLGDTGRSPEETLRFALKRTYAADRICRFGMRSTTMALAFLAIVWMLDIAGLIPRHDPILLITVLSLCMCAAFYTWFSWRRPRIARERVQCERLLAQFDGP
jgi:hypothetical protein